MVHVHVHMSYIVNRDIHVKMHGISYKYAIYVYTCMYTCTYKLVFTEV